MKIENFHKLLRFEPQLIPYFQLFLPDSVIPVISADMEHFSLELLQRFEKCVDYIAFRSIWTLSWNEENYTVGEVTERIDSRPSKKPEHVEYLTTVRFAVAYADSQHPRIAYLNDDEHGSQEDLKSLVRFLRDSRSPDLSRIFKYIFRHSFRRLLPNDGRPQLLVQENLVIYKIGEYRFPN